MLNTNKHGSDFKISNQQFDLCLCGLSHESQASSTRYPNTSRANLWSITWQFVIFKVITTKQDNKIFTCLCVFLILRIYKTTLAKQFFPGLKPANVRTGPADPTISNSLTIPFVESPAAKLVEPKPLSKLTDSETL